MIKMLNHQYILALILGLIISLNGFSQAYTFSKGSETYSHLTAPTTLSGSTYWDEEYWVIPIGFNFLGHDTLTVSSNGLVSLADYNKLVDQEVTFSISAFADASIGADLIARDLASPTNSPINYQLSGSFPNQILKIEWRNAGFYHDNSSNKIDFISFQLWLYEDSNNIEMRYGPHYFASLAPFTGNNSFGAVIGIGSYKYDFLFGGSLNEYVNSAPSIYLTGNVNTPGTSSTFGTLTANDTASCAPARNTRFKFTPDFSVTGVRKSSGLATNIYPNPVNGMLHVEFENKSGAGIFLYDISGKLVHQEYTAPSSGLFSGLIQTEEFPKGLYFLKIESEGSVCSRIISIQ
jgi:hypothetical protein